MKKLRFVGHKLDNKSNGEEKKICFSYAQNKVPLIIYQTDLLKY